MTGTIRLAKRQDASNILAIYRPIVHNTSCSFELTPPSTNDMEQRILKTLERLPWLSCAVGSDVLGYAYANPHRVRASYQWSVEVSVYVHEHHRQKGIARALYTSLFTILRLQGFYNAYAGITLPNTGGVHLHESFGFEPVGIYKSVAYKLNKWHDVGWWQLQLHEHPVVPQPPARFDSVRESHGWAAALAAGEPLLKL